MALETWGVVAEIVGSTGVVVSLVYLALQIRGQSAQTNQANHQLAIDEFTGKYSEMRNTDTNAGLYLKAIGSYSDLSEVERTRFDALMLNMMVGYNKIQRLHGAGLLESREFDAMEDLMVRIVKSPGTANWWADVKEIYPPQVREGLDDALKRKAHLDSDFDKWAGKK